MFNILVVKLLWFDNWFPLCVFPIWELCALISHEVYLCCMRVPSQLLNVSCGHFRAFHLLCKVVHLACQKPVKVYISFIDCFWYKLFIPHKKPEDISVQYFGCFQRVFCQSDLGLYSAVPFINAPVALSDTNSSSLIKSQKISLCCILAVSRGYFARVTWACTVLYQSLMLLLPCLKLVRRSNWALTPLDWGFQNSSNWSHIVSKLSSSLGMHHDIYWSIPRSQLQAVFLHFCHSGEGCKLTFQYIFAL